MKLLKKLPYLLLSVVMLTNCSQLKELADIKKPSVSVDDFRITDLSLDDVELTFDLEIDNPNPVALTLSSYDYDLQVESNSFVKGSQPLDTKIEANNQNLVSVPVKFTFKELYNTFASIGNKDESDYSFLVNIEVNVPVLGLVEIPIKKEGTFPVVKAPSISLANFSVKDISFTKADVELELNVSNPNTFGMILNELNYNVSLEGLSAISGETDNPVEIGEKETGTIVIPASFSFLDLGMAAYNALTDDAPIQYSFSGNADVGATLPFFESSSFNFDKSGAVDVLR